MTVQATDSAHRAVWLAVQHQMAAVDGRILLTDADAVFAAKRDREIAVRNHVETLSGTAVRKGDAEAERLFKGLGLKLIEIITNAPFQI